MCSGREDVTSAQRCATTELADSRVGKAHLGLLLAKSADRDIRLW